VPHLTAKKAPISLVRCTRVLGGGLAGAPERHAPPALGAPTVPNPAFRHDGHPYHARFVSVSSTTVSQHPASPRSLDGRSQPSQDIREWNHAWHDDRLTDCASAASERVPHREREITMVPHLDTKIAPISLVRCTRVLGLGVHSWDGVLVCGLCVDHRSSRSSGGIAHCSVASRSNQARVQRAYDRLVPLCDAAVRDGVADRVNGARVPRAYDRPLPLCDAAHRVERADQVKGARTARI